MDNEEAIFDILERWEAARDAGKPVALKELCAQRPELLDEVERRAKALRFMGDLAERDVGSEDGETDFIARFSTIASSPHDAQQELQHRAPNEARGVKPVLAGLMGEVPSHIGAYRVLEVLGEGGCGVVYLAEQQQPIRRLVALKIIKPGMDSAQIIARFEAERQALAMMSHACIAQVFDAGVTERGRPYFAMEYVKGQPITRYCERQKLSVGDRLRLFVSVCAAVQHAHQKGIIHRDLKPSNILVYRQDDKAHVKVIDFGVAKAMSQPLTEQTLHTMQGQVIGTLEYMSPEQLDGGEIDIDTRTDIYALGVVLYELLTGLMPFETGRLRARGIVQARKIVREEMPPAPSRRVVDPTPSLVDATDRQPGALPALQRMLSGDLDWITLKAMGKEPVDRYASAAELGADVERHLNDEPVLAGPPSWRYRMGKFVRKHRAPVMTGAIAAAVLMLVVVVTFTMTALALVKERAATADMTRELYYNRLGTARDEIERGRVARAGALLTACPLELRGWEWRRLRYLADSSIGTFGGHEAAVTALAVSPDETMIAYGSAVGGVLVSPVGHAQPRTMQQSRSVNEVLALKYTARGDRLMACTSMRMVGWDGAGSEVVMDDEFHTNQNATELADFSRDGGRVVYRSVAGSVAVRQVEGGEELTRIAKMGEGVSAVLMSGRGDRVLLGDSTGGVAMWDVATGVMAWRLQVYEYEKAGIGAMALSPREDWLAVGGGQGDVAIYDFGDWERAEERRAVATLRTGDAAIRAIAFSDDGGLLACGGEDGLISIWDRASGERLATLAGHEGDIRRLTFMRDGQRLLSSSGDGMVKLWDWRAIDPTWRLPGSWRKEYPIRFDGVGGQLAWVDEHDNLRIVKALEGAAVNWFKVTATGAGPARIAWRPDGARIAVCVQDGSARRDVIEIVDAATGRALSRLSTETQPIAAMAWSPDGVYLASAYQGGTIRIQEIGSTEVVNTLRGHDEDIECLAYHPDGDWIAVGGKQGGLWLHARHLPGEPVRLKGHVGAIAAMAFSPDGERLVTSGPDAVVRVWDATRFENPNELVSFNPKVAGVSAMSFDANGDDLWTVHEDGMVRRWGTK